MTGPRRTIAWNAVAAFATQATSASFTAALTLYLTRALSPTGYGLVGLASAVGGLVLLPADFGVSQAASRFAAENRDDPAEVAGVLGGSVRIKAIFTVGTGAALFGLSQPIAAAYGTHALVWPLRAVAIAMVAQSFMNTFCYALSGLARTALTIPVYFVESALETGLGIGLVALGGGATGAMFGRAAGYVVAALLSGAILLRVVGERLVVRSDLARRWSRALRRYGGALVVVDSAYTLFNQVDALLIGLLLDTRAVGLYAAPFRLLGFLGLPANAISTGVGPRMVTTEAGRPDARPLVVAAQIVAYMQMAAIPPLLLWPGPIARRVFGADFGGSASVLRGFAPFVFLLGFGLLFSIVANYLGQARARVPVAVGTAALNIVADLILIPTVGVAGAAIGTDIAYAFYAPAHVWICRRSVPFAVSPLVRACARSVVAGTAMGGAMLAVAGTDPRLPLMLAGYAGGVAAFALVLALTGALGDARSVWRQAPGEATVE
jgi:O-antigen/teichoic acid export membrane protein